MQAQTLPLDSLVPAEKYLLSYPLKPHRYRELREQLPGFPLVLANPAGEIIFGVDYYRYLQGAGVGDVLVMTVDTDEKDALILAYNLKAALDPPNPYEKLLFIKKITPLAGVGEIYQKTDPDISINRQLLQHLDLLLGTEFRDPLANRRISLKTAIRLCGWGAENRGPMLELFDAVHFSDSHQLKLLEMAEEILFRDKVDMQTLLRRLNIDTRDEGSKEIIRVFFNDRYPRYARSEERWQKEIGGLKLPGHITVRHPAFFERKGLEVTVRVEDIDQLKELLAGLDPDGFRSRS